MVIVSTLLLHGLQVQPLAVHQLPTMGGNVMGLPPGRARQEVQVRARAAAGAVTGKPASQLHDVKLVPEVPEGRRTDHLDLAVALAMLGHEPPVDAVVLGGLAMNGDVMPMRGVVPMLQWGAQHGKARQGIIPSRNLREAAAATALVRCGAHSLDEVLRREWRCDDSATPPLQATPMQQCGAPPPGGNTWPWEADAALHALATGEVRSLLWVYRPGTRPRQAYNRLPLWMPVMQSHEVNDVLCCYSASGLHMTPGFRPIRVPHHTVTATGMLGGGRPLALGEVTLAHRGVLVLDDVLQWRPSVLDPTLQALQRREVQPQPEGPVLPADALLLALEPEPADPWGWGRVRALQGRFDRCCIEGTPLD